MANGFLIPLVLFVACVVVRDFYELLKQGGKIDLENKLIFAAIFASMCVLWASWFTLCPADPLPIELPGLIRWSGLAIVVLGGLVAVGALIQLRGVENIDHLVTSGLFKTFRHPMYLGFISWIVGWSIYHGAMVSLAVGLLGIASVLWWMRLEDARLAKQFGNRYSEYLETTWF